MGSSNGTRTPIMASLMETGAGATVVCPTSTALSLLRTGMIANTIVRGGALHPGMISTIYVVSWIDTVRNSVTSPYFCKNSRSIGIYVIPHIKFFFIPV